MGFNIYVFNKTSRLIIYATNNNRRDLIKARIFMSVYIIYELISDFRVNVLTDYMLLNNAGERRECSEGFRIMMYIIKYISFFEPLALSIFNDVVLTYFSDDGEE